MEAAAAAAAEAYAPRWRCPYLGFVLDSSLSKAPTDGRLLAASSSKICNLFYRRSSERLTSTCATYDTSITCYMMLVAGVALTAISRDHVSNLVKIIMSCRFS